MSTIAAGTTSGTALVSTGNTDGTLQLQVNGTTPSVTLAANGSVGVGSSPSYGNSGQVLTSSGTGSAPTWTTPSAGPVTLITSTTATAASSVVFTGLSTTYGMYLLEYDSVFGSAGDNLVLTISANNGSSYYSSSYAVQGTYTVNGSNSVYATTTDPFFYLGPITGSNTSLSNPSSGSIWMYNPAASKQFTAQNLSASRNGSGNMENTVVSYGGPNGTSAINAIKIVFAGAATITGKFRLYGYSAV